MSLPRLTDDQLLADICTQLASGNHRQTAERVKSIAKRKPELAVALVDILADAIHSLGDKNPGKRGPGSNRPPTIGETYAKADALNREWAAEESYDRLMLARDIVDNREPEAEGMTIADAKDLLTAWGLANKERGKFRIALREAVAKRHKVTVKKSR